MRVAVSTRVRSGLKSQIAIAGCVPALRSGVPSSEAASLAQEERNTRKRYGGVRMPIESYAQRDERMPQCNCRSQAKAEQSKR